MKLLTLSITLLFSINGFAQGYKTPSSAAEFCENMSKISLPNKNKRPGSNGEQRGYSLRNIRIALGLLSVNFGPMAKASTPRFQAQGFENLLEKQPNLLSEPSKIPDGAIFILDKADSPDCPVNAMAGHVAVKCGSNSLLWQPGVKDLSAFITENPKCIKSVMFNPKWSKTNKAADENANNPSVK